MKSVIFVCLLIFQISYSEHTVCFSNEPPTLVKIQQLPLKNNNLYQFRINNYANPTLITRNQNGTFFFGNFSKIALFGDKKSYDYISNSFSFKYPPQHRIAQVNTQMLQLQIKYELSSPQESTWKHKTIYLSICFILTQYAPQDKLTLSKQVNQNLSNNTIIDMKALLPLINNLNMYLYKGTHSDNPSDRLSLWLIRKEMLLMSLQQMQAVKQIIFGHLKREEMNYHGLLERLSDLNEIQQMQIMHQVKMQQF